MTTGGKKKVWHPPPKPKKVWHPPKQTVASSTFSVIDSFGPEYINELGYDPRTSSLDRRANGIKGNNAFERFFD